jgi:urate oxidase
MQAQSRAVLGENRYGKAEIRLMKVDRDTPRHVVHDLNVSVALSGDFEAVHLVGDNSAVLPTDSQKNTVFAVAREHGVGSPEDFAARLAAHFVDTQRAVRRAQVDVVAHAWERIGAHSFAGTGPAVRTASVVHDADGTRTVSGVSGLLLLNTTDSQFTGYVVDPYTTLPEAEDRILCTSVDARWRHEDPRADWDSSYDGVLEALQGAFAETYSKSLQQTLFAMGRRAVEACGVSEIRLRLPNRHHLLVDLGPFRLENPNEVFHVDDRPYGLIEGTVLAADAAPDPGPW